MTAYYNEIDPYAAQWLRNLIAAGHIAPGVVDERSIEDVRPWELFGYTQCHFFAGVGVWSLALRNAGWPDDRPVWTGSCPCQPFSSAGKGDGFNDERHLWPHFQWLIQQCRPAIVFGEQVASKDAEPWVDLVHADVEAMGYAFGCVPFPSASIGAPHIRDRNYWVAYADNTRLQGHRGLVERSCAERRETQKRQRTETSVVGGVANSASLRCGCGSTCSEIQEGREPRPDGGGKLANGLEGRAVYRGECAAVQRDRPDVAPCPTNGFWRAADWLHCRDGKWRPVEPGTFPLAHGATSRVGRLRAYGNAINAEQAKTFIECVMELENV